MKLLTPCVTMNKAKHFWVIILIILISFLTVRTGGRKNSVPLFPPDGKRVQSPKKGLNIIRRSDGTVKKVVVK